MTHLPPPSRCQRWRDEKRTRFFFPSFPANTYRAAAGPRVSVEHVHDEERAAAARATTRVFGPRAFTWHTRWMAQAAVTASPYSCCSTLPRESRARTSWIYFVASFPFTCVCTALWHAQETIISEICNSDVCARIIVPTYVLIITFSAHVSTRARRSASFYSENGRYITQ